MDELSSWSSDNGDIGRQGLLKISSSLGSTGLSKKMFKKLITVLGKITVLFSMYS